MEYTEDPKEVTISETSHDEEEHHEDFGNITTKITSKTYLWALCAAVNSCNLGYDIGVNTGAGPLVQTTFDLSELQIEIFMGSINVFSLFGAFLSSYVSDTYGRKKAFTVAAVTFIVGVIITSAANGLALLLFGRLFVGLGIGFGLALDPVYISEISPAAHRGELVTWSEIATTVGILLGFCSGLIFSGIGETVAWRYMFALGLIMPIIMIFLANFVMVESPRWLISKGNNSQAKNILQEIYGSNYDVDPIIIDVQESLEREAAASKAIGWNMIFSPPPAFRRMLLVGVGIAIAQQAVGIDAIQYFLAFILQESGIKSRIDQTLLLILLGFVKLVFTVIGGKLFDRMGRRPLFFISLCGMTIALNMLAFNFLGGSNNTVFSIFSLALYLAMFGLGMGPGAWLIPAEIFPTCIRAKAMSVATFGNRGAAAIFASTFLTTANAMSWAGFFFMLSGICLIVIIFVYFYLPETKGRSLEDISTYLAEITNDRSILDAEANIRSRKSTDQSTPQPFVPPAVQAGML